MQDMCRLLRRQCSSSYTLWTLLNTFKQIYYRPGAALYVGPESELMLKIIDKQSVVLSGQTYLATGATLCTTRLLLTMALTLDGKLRPAGRITFSASVNGEVAAHFDTAT